MNTEVEKVRHLGQSPQSIDALLVGTHYRVVERLGRGGMGEVFIVLHTILKRRFALKVVHARLSGCPHFADRMRIEAQAAARLEHPNIVDVVDFWVAANHRPCMVMELLSGNNLAQELATRRALSASESIDYVLQLLSALGAVHELGLVHRDIKPENLFIQKQHDQPHTLKLLDFGVARVMPAASPRAPSPPQQATIQGAIVGTPRFASPEALRGEPVDARADLYSAGLILYYMLTGHYAVERTALADSLGLTPVRPVSELVGPSVTPRLDAIISKSLSVRVEQRFKDAASFARALLSYRRQQSGLVRHFL